jgi:hypothetical protein
MEEDYKRAVQREAEFYHLLAEAKPFSECGDQEDVGAKR